MMHLRSSYVPAQASIGRGTTFAYGGISVVLHRRTFIGTNVTVGQNVTIGAKDSTAPDRVPGAVAPDIHEGVFIGPGAVILGPIRIGAFSIIGANAVVTKDLPPGSVVGVSGIRKLAMINSENILNYRSLFTSVRDWPDQQLVKRTQELVDNCQNG
jgi:serine O-acetyltransferase